MCLDFLTFFRAGRIAVTDEEAAEPIRLVEVRSSPRRAAVPLNYFGQPAIYHGAYAASAMTYQENLINGNAQRAAAQPTQSAQGFQSGQALQSAQASQSAQQAQAPQDPQQPAQVPQSAPAQTAQRVETPLSFRSEAEEIKWHRDLALARLEGRVPENCTPSEAQSWMVVLKEDDPEPIMNLTRR